MKKILVFTLFWFILNLVQAFFTEIIDDEAYYWVYSGVPDWGYFDHPPMIALLIRAGYALMEHPLGVRLFNSLLGAGTVFIIMYMTRDRIGNLRNAFLLMLAIPLLHFHVAGFLATPDLPLVFFTALFFLFYRRYLASDTLVNSAWLIASIVLLLYSKYHGFLVIGLTVLSNLKLLQRRSFWIIVIGAVLLFLPHILWQIRHDFVSLSYHLVERNQPFRIVYFLKYAGSQLLILGPVTGVLLLFSGFRTKPQDAFERALKFNFTGFFLFFLFSSLKGNVEAHWTAAAFVPLLIFTLPFLDDRHWLKKRVVLFSALTIPLILIARILLMVDTGLIPGEINGRFHGQEEAYMQISKRAAGRPVVFTNSYQHASLYRFYTGEPAFSQNNKSYRKNQYDLMDMEAALHGRAVLQVPYEGSPGCDTLVTGIRDFVLCETEFYCWYNRVRIHPPELSWNFEPGERVRVDLLLENPTSDTVTFCCDCTYPPKLIYTFYSSAGEQVAYTDRKSGRLPDLPPESTRVYPIQMKVPEQPGTYHLMFSFGSKYVPAGINGKPVRMTVHARSTGS